MNRDKMLEAMMKAVTDAVVDVNVEEILAKVYPQIDEKIHETYGFLPEVHEVRTPTAIWQYEHSMIDDNILIDLDHDAGDYAFEGGDYIKLLDWLEAKNIVDTGYSFHLHSMNPVGVQNMRAIIKKNGWREI